MENSEIDSTEDKIILLQDKITLSKSLQKEMIKFFLKTSIPRKKLTTKDKTINQLN